MQTTATWKRVKSGLARHALVLDGKQVAFILAPTSEGKHRWVFSGEHGSCDTLPAAKTEAEKRANV